MTSDDYRLPKPSWRLTIAGRLVALRTRIKLKQSEASRAIGFSPKDYELGDCFPSLTRLAALARFYDCSVDYILLGIGWGGVPVADYDALIHSLPQLYPAVPQIEKAPKPKGKGVSLKAKPPAPVKLREVKIKATTPAKKSRAKKAPAITKVPPRKGEMLYNFKL